MWACLLNVTFVVSLELWAGFALSEKQRNEAGVRREDTLTLMEKS